MRPAVFTVDTFSAGQGQVTVYLDHPDGTREEVWTKSSSSFFLSPSFQTAVFSLLLDDRHDTWLTLKTNPNLCVCVCVCVDQLKAQPNEAKPKTFTVTYVPRVIGPHKVSFISFSLNI